MCYIMVFDIKFKINMTFSLMQNSRIKQTIKDFKKHHKTKVSKHQSYLHQKVLIN